MTFPKICFFILILINKYQVFSQQWVEKMQDPTVNFYETKAAFDAYWEGKTIEKGKGYTVFKRWENFVEPRVFPSGDLSLLGQSATNYAEWEAEQAAAGVPKSLNGTWTSIGPNGSFGGSSGNAGRLNFIRFDPSNSNTLWVGAPDGGLWKSTDGGNTWITNTDELSVIGVSDVAIDPQNTQIMYLATGDSDGGDTYSTGILKSVDGGTSWSNTGLNWMPSQGKRIGRVLINPINTQIILVFSNSGIYRSINGGVTFSLTSGGATGFKDGEFKPGDPNTVYAASGAFFCKSTNGGATWTSVNLPLTGIGRLSLAVSDANPSVVYLLASSSSDNGFKGLMRSSNSGTNFTIQSATPNILGYSTDGSSTGGQGWYDLAIAVNPTNDDEIIVGGINQWKSINGGVSFNIFTFWSWNPQGIPQIHADVHDIQYLPGAGNVIFSATDGGLFKTTDGITWVGLNNNLVIAQQYRIALSSSSPGIILTGHQDNGTNKTTDLINWFGIYGADGMDCLVDWNNSDNHVFTMQNGNHFRYFNGTVQLIADPPGGSWVSPIHQDPQNPNVIYAGGRQALYKCSNMWTPNQNDVVWQIMGTPSPPFDIIIELAIAPSNNQIIYTLKSGGISKSIDGGNTFISCSNPSNYPPTQLAISNVDPNVLFVTYSGYSSSDKVFKSLDGGNSWINLSAGLPNIPVNCVVYQHNPDGGNRIYIGTDNGVFYRDNSTNGWVQFSSGLPNCAIMDLEIFYPSNILRAATYGRGTWESDLYNFSPIGPQAFISSSTTPPCVTENVQFSSLSYGIPTSYNWTFPGGNPSTSSLQNPIVIYNNSGNYDVSLTVMNVNGSDSILHTETISISQSLPLNEGFETNVNFTYTGIPQNYIVPSGVSSLICKVEGAQGEGIPGCGDGGLGARVISTISVTPGESLQINVGGQGISSIGGFNGGGNGASCTQIIGGGGGGASDIRMNGNSLSNRVVVAAGGGGAGINCMNNSDHGGGGGATVGLSGYQCNSQTLTVGLGGTQSAGGVSLSYFGIQGTSGSLGQGGNGTCTYGGGGGGGFYGGGGGSFGGGGGGSSFAANIAPTNIFTPNVVSGNGQVVLDIFPPQHWSIYDPANLGTWQEDTTVGCNPTPDNCVAFYNFWIAPDGNVDELQTPKLDFSNLSSAILTFDIAYAAYNSTYYDALEILVSNDCGNSWSSVYFKTGSNIAPGNLPTVAAQSFPFVPLANQWRTDTVNLNAYINNPNVQIAFRNIEGQGNHLYLDNINVSGAPPTSPMASFVTNFSNSICQGDSIQYTSTSSGIPITHNWSFPGGTPSTSSGLNPSITYNNSGNYSAQLIVSNSTGSDTLNMNNIIVNSFPNVSLDLSSIGTPCVNYNSVPLTGGIPLGGIYSGTAVSNGIFNPSLAGVGLHSIIYSYTENGCAENATTDLLVDACSSIINLTNNEILIYPNPTDGKLIIETNSIDQFMDIYLIDISGRICEIWKLDNDKMEIDLCKYANGFYNLKFGNQLFQINKSIQILK